MNNVSENKISLTAKVRSALLVFLPLLHVTLIIAPIYTFLACVAYVDSGISSVQYFFSSLLFIIPAAITKYSSMYIKQLWVYIVLSIVLVVATRYVSLGSVAAAAACPFFSLYYFWGEWIAVALCCITACTVVWAHRGNIQRLLAGNERRIGQKKEATEEQ